MRLTNWYVRHTQQALFHEVSEPILACGIEPKGLRRVPREIDPPPRLHLPIWPGDNREPYRACVAEYPYQATEYRALRSSAPTR